MPGQCRGRRVLCALAHERAWHLPPPWPQGHQDKRPEERLPRNSPAVLITASSRRNPRSRTPVHKSHMIAERRGNASPPSLLHCQGQTSFLSAPHPGCYLHLFSHKCLVSSEGLEAAGLGVGREQATRLQARGQPGGSGGQQCEHCKASDYTWGDCYKEKVQGGWRGRQGEAWELPAGALWMKDELQVE